MITDEMLRLAAGELESAAMLSLPEPAECCRQFSARFQRKMKKLMYRAEHPIAFRLTRQIAAVFLAILLLGGAVLMVSPEARAAFTGWIREVYETYDRYFFGSEMSAGAEVDNYVPSYIPAGFDLLDVIETDAVTTMVWQNAEGKMLYFSRFFNLDSSAVELYIEKENVACKTVTVNGVTADFYYGENNNQSNAVVWKDDQKKGLYMISAMLDEEVLIRIAESVGQKEKQ